MSMKVKLECGGVVAIYPGKGKDDPPVLTVIDDEGKSAVVTLTKVETAQITSGLRSCIRRQR